MDKKLRFHLTRIIMTTTFLMFTVFLWQDANFISSNALAYQDQANKYLHLVELSDGIKLENAYPVSDNVGMKANGYIFKVVNNTNTLKKYQINFVNTLDESYEALDNKFIRYQIVKNGEIIINAATVPDDGVLLTDEITRENIYELKLWIAEDATNEAMGKYFSSKIALL